MNLRYSSTNTKTFRPRYTVEFVSFKEVAAMSLIGFRYPFVECASFFFPPFFFPIAMFLGDDN